MAHINYTIIIPHHNNATLLRRCLQSVPLRNDLQTIVVDDVSNSENCSNLKKLEKIFPHIQFLYLSNGSNGSPFGAGKARNEGLKHVEGKYVLFADADDFFNYCIDSILETYKDSDYDAIFFNANSLNSDTYLHETRCWQLNNMICDYFNNQERGLFQLRYIFGEPWCKIVKASIIFEHNIQFQETLIHNDTKYSYLIGYFAKTFHVEYRAGYCVTSVANSVSKQTSSDRYITRAKVFAEANRFFENHQIDFFHRFAIDPIIHFQEIKDSLHEEECRNILHSFNFDDKTIDHQIKLVKAEEKRKKEKEKLKKFVHKIFN